MREKRFRTSLAAIGWVIGLLPSLVSGSHAWGVSPFEQSASEISNQNSFQFQDQHQTQSQNQKQWSARLSTQAEGPLVGQSENPILSQVRAELEFDQELTWTHFRADAEVFAYLSGFGGTSTVHIPELYFETPESLSTNFRFGLGRKKRDWSAVDEDWQLGVIQPRFRPDFLASQNSGLFGGHFDFRVRNFNWGVVASPLFIPEQGALFSFQEGRCESRSLWFTCPESRPTPLNVPTDINYNLELGSIGELLTQTTLMAYFDVEVTPGVSFHFSGGLQPVHQVGFEFEGFLNASSVGTGSANIFPRIRKHWVAAADLRFVRKGFFGSFSVLRESPIEDRLVEERTSEVLDDASVLSPSLGWKGVWLGREKIQLSTSYLRVFGGRSSCSGSLCPESGSPFEERYSFRDAISAQFSTSVPGVSDHRLSLHSSVKYDWFFNHSVFQTMVDYRVLENLQVIAGVDFLAAGDSQGAGTVDQRSDWVSQYRANDRWFGGVAYVF